MSDIQAGRTAWLLAIGMLAMCGIGGGLVPATQANESKSTAKSIQVKEIEDIAYYEGNDAHKVKHKLDLYLPSGKKDFPVLFFVHGGAWTIGDKNQFGIYRGIGRCFAKQGIGVVMTNYRLSPDVKHPAHIQDVAKAFAWTYKNIKKYGGRPDQIFVSGQSAGGHLVALLATDDTYLKAEGLTLKAIKGAMPISGLYQIPDFPALDPVFGKDRAVRKKASPITHARADAPPFLILFANDELPGCDRKAATAFCQTLVAKKAHASTLEIKSRNHITILLSMLSAQDPAAKAIVEFIHRHTTPVKER
jgi:acetyl esterase/lipase